METAIDCDGNEVSADGADRSRGYICRTCRLPVFPKQGETKAAHFSHHNDKPNCPDYHRSHPNGFSKKIAAEFRSMLEDEFYIARWNSIILFFLRNNTLSDYQYYERLLLPVVRFIELERTISTKDRFSIFSFVSAFSPQALLKNHIQLDSLRLALGIASSSPKLSRQSKKRLSLEKSSLANRVQPEVFSALGHLAKTNTLLEVLRSGEKSHDATTLLKNVCFSQEKTSEYWVRIPFDRLPYLSSITPLLKAISREKFEDLIERQSSPTTVRSFLEKHYAARFSEEYFRRPW